MFKLFFRTIAAAVALVGASTLPVSAQKGATLKAMDGMAIPRYEATEVTDYVVPYGVLAESGVADVWALRTSSGPIQIRMCMKEKRTSSYGKPTAAFVALTMEYSWDKGNRHSQQARTTASLQ